jgi:putative sigma-54 modulation protein
VRIEIRGRNVEITDELQEHVRKRFASLGRQVSPLARLEVELSEEPNPRVANRHVAQATLHLKGNTLHAKHASPEMLHSIHEAAEVLRRQVKRDRELRRGRSLTRRALARLRRQEG